MPKRIAVIDRGKCTREKCGWMCMKVCPVNRMGQECIVKDAERWPVISEELCTGCGLCPKKCPVKCIKIINLVEEKGKLIHQYGVNSFRLYNLPLPKPGAVVGLIGANGIGKTTALQLLSERMRPNLGDYARERSWREVIDAFKGQEIQNYFEKLSEGGVKVSLKPQAIDRIPELFSGKVRDLLKKADERKVLGKGAREFGLEEILDRDVKNLSGGELQRVAICAAWTKESDVYYFDEPSSHLDIKQRMRVAKSIRGLADEKGKSVMVVEHDLAVLDYLSEYINVFFGEKGAYGVVSRLKGARNGVNEYLDGFLRDENTRIREYSIKFEMTAEIERKTTPYFDYPALKKEYKGFSLECAGGAVRKGEIIGIVGENAIGKTTFVKLLAGIEEPDGGKWGDQEEPQTEGGRPNCATPEGVAGDAHAPRGSAQKLKISYKPQYIKSDFTGTVAELIMQSGMSMEVFEREIKRRLEIDDLMEKDVRHLSGGELQRVAIAIALGKEADLYLLDEPSAFLDVEQRLNFAHAVKNIVEGGDKTAFVVDHDIVLIDAVSSRLLVFEGESSVRGFAHAPEEKRSGMNRFLKEMDVTLRRDKDSGRPRVNKPGSQMDMEQKAAGEYYYYAN